MSRAGAALSSLMGEIVDLSEQVTHLIYPDEVKALLQQASSAADSTAIVGPSTATASSSTGPHQPCPNHKHAPAGVGGSTTQKPHQQSQLKRAGTQGSKSHSGHAQGPLNGSSRHDGTLLRAQSDPTGAATTQQQHSGARGASTEGTPAAAGGSSSSKPAPRKAAGKTDCGSQLDATLALRSHNLYAKNVIIWTLAPFPFWAWDWGVSVSPTVRAVAIFASSFGFLSGILYKRYESAVGHGKDRA